LVEGLIALMEHEGSNPGPVNLGNPTELSVRQLVELVLELTGSSSEVVRRRLPVDDPKRRRPDIRKARELLGWAPRTPLERGLRSTIAWFEDQAGRQTPKLDEARLTA
jgi:UDP-glucuronate decarboxylase